jgi:hypothetical protein
MCTVKIVFCGGITLCLVERCGPEWRSRNFSYMVV